MNTLRSLTLLSLALVLCGCATVTPYDYTNIRAHPPRSILVLPPLNNSTAVEGTYSYLSTVSMPLAERGYYVFPVAEIDQFLKENGMPTAGEMHNVPLARIAEVTGADAVLYVTLEQYGAKYQLVNAAVIVAARAKLVDTRTGLVLWEGSGTAQNSSSNSSGNILADMIAAAITQAINSKTDAARPVCRMANAQMFFADKRSLPYGPYSAMYGKDP